MIQLITVKSISETKTKKLREDTPDIKCDFKIEDE